MKLSKLKFDDKTYHAYQTDTGSHNNPLWLYLRKKTANPLHPQRWVSSWIIPSNPMVFCLVVKSGLQRSSNLLGTTPGKLQIAEMQKKQNKAYIRQILKFRYILGCNVSTQWTIESYPNNHIFNYI